MQKNITELLLGRDSKKIRDHAPSENIRNSNAKQPNSTLLRMLSSKTLTKKNKRQPRKVTTKVPELETKEKPEMKRCAFCGLEIDQHIYSEHLKEELEKFNTDDDENSWFPEDERGNNNSPSYNNGQKRSHNSINSRPTQHRRGKVVFVLGGAPEISVPKNPKRLKYMKIPKLNKTKSAPTTYDHYNDGGGELDGDEIGLEGHENIGISWEGMGTTAF